MHAQRKFVVLLLSVGLTATSCTQHESGFANRPRFSKNPLTERVVKGAREIEPPKILPKTHFAAARLFESRGQFSKAIIQYRKAVAVDHNYFEAYHRLGVLLSLMGKRDDAMAFLRRAVELRPEDALARNNLGFELMLQNLLWQSESQFRKAIELKPDFARAYINLGLVQAKMGRFDEALASFRTVLPDVDAYYNLGLMYKAQKRFEDAAVAFRHVLELNPQFTAASTQLQQLESQRQIRMASNRPTFSTRNFGRSIDDLSNRTPVGPPLPASKPALDDTRVTSRGVAHPGRQREPASYWNHQPAKPKVETIQGPARVARREPGHGFDAEPRPARTEPRRRASSGDAREAFGRESKPDRFSRHETAADQVATRRPASGGDHQQSVHAHTTAPETKEVPARDTTDWDEALSLLDEALKCEPPSTSKKDRAVLLSGRQDQVGPVTESGTFIPDSTTRKRHEVNRAPQKVDFDAITSTLEGEFKELFDGQYDGGSDSRFGAQPGGPRSDAGRGPGSRSRLLAEGHSSSTARNGGREAFGEDVGEPGSRTGHRVADSFRNAGSRRDRVRLIDAGAGYDSYDDDGSDLVSELYPKWQVRPWCVNTEDTLTYTPFDYVGSEPADEFESCVDSWALLRELESALSVVRNDFDCLYRQQFLGDTPSPAYANNEEDGAKDTAGDNVSNRARARLMSHREKRRPANTRPDTGLPYLKPRNQSRPSPQPPRSEFRRERSPQRSNLRAAADSNWQSEMEPLDDLISIAINDIRCDENLSSEDEAIIRELLEREFTSECPNVTWFDLNSCSLPQTGWQELFEDESGGPTGHGAAHRHPGHDDLHGQYGRTLGPGLR